MEGSDSEGKQAENSNSRNWDELFNLFVDVITRGDGALKIQAMIKLANMTRYAPDDILARTVPICLVRLQSPPSNHSQLIREASAHCLKCIAARGKSALADLICQLGAVPVMLRLLPDSLDGLQRSLLKCLRNLVSFWAPSRVILASNGGLEIVLDMLSSCSEDSKLIILEILSALALIREVRKSLWTSRKVHHLVEAAKCGRLVSRTRAAQAIGLLGLIKRARRSLVDAGAVNALMELLKDGDCNVKLIAANALGVISSHVDHIRPIARAGVIPLYAELLKGSDGSIGKEIAEDVFCVLAAYEENAVEIVEQLVEILEGDNVGAKAAAADVIWDLSSYKYSFPVLKNSGAIPILVGLLSDENVEVRERVVGAVAQLSFNEDDRAVLASSGAIPLLISMLEDEEDEVRDNAAEALVYFSLDPLHGDSVSCVLENPRFWNMFDRVMQLRASDEQMDVSLLQTDVEQLI